MSQKILTDMDYVELYAKTLKNNPELFKQQKILIESQLKASRELFLKRFGKFICCSVFRNCSHIHCHNHSNGDIY